MYNSLRLPDLHTTKINNNNKKEITIITNYPPPSLSLNPSPFINDSIIYCIIKSNSACLFFLVSTLTHKNCMTYDRKKCLTYDSKKE